MLVHPHLPNPRAHPRAHLAAQARRIRSCLHFHVYNSTTAGSVQNPPDHRFFFFFFLPALSPNQTSPSHPSAPATSLTIASTALVDPQPKRKPLHIEADENVATAEEVKAKVKTVEQDDLPKEQEITSLTHCNQLLEAGVEKLETALKEAKAAAGEASQHGQQNEALTRRLQFLEEEAEAAAADKTLRETNDDLRQTDDKAGHFERKI